MEQNSQTSIVVGSYNVRAGLGTDLRRDAGRTLGAIADLGLDIAVVQEADFRMGPRPTALPFEAIERDTGLIPVSRMDGADSLGWHGIGLLARPEIGVTDVARFDLPGLEPRGAILADLETPIGPLRVIGVHLGLLRRSRRAQLTRLRQIAKAREPLPTIFAGDFNEWSRRRGLGRLARDFQIVTPGPSFPSRYPALALDRFVHSLDLTIAARPIRPTGRGPHPSDHLPIVAQVQRNGYIHAR